MNSAFKDICTVTGSARLAERVGQVLRQEGDHYSAIPGLSFHRRNAVTEPLHCIYALGLGLTLQGGKQVMVGEEVPRSVDGDKRRHSRHRKCHPCQCVPTFHRDDSGAGQHNGFAGSRAIEVISTNER